MFYDELTLGLKARFEYSVADADRAFYNSISGHAAPMHDAQVTAPTSLFIAKNVHGMLSGRLLCGGHGMQLAGAGAIQLEQLIKSKASVRTPHTVTGQTGPSEPCSRSWMGLLSRCTHQNHVEGAEGGGLVLAPGRLSDQPADSRRGTK
jgi:hypothetical protein